MKKRNWLSKAIKGRAKIKSKGCEEEFFSFGTLELACRQPLCFLRESVTGPLI